MTNTSNLEFAIRNSGLDEKQKGAIALAVTTGIILQKRYPQITEDYRNGKTLSEIVTKYNIAEDYNLTDEISKQSVHYMLCGFKGGFGLKLYGGSLTKEELSVLSYEHITEGARKSGNLSFELNKGIHGLTPNQRYENSLNAGKHSYELQRGIHALDSTGKADAARKSQEVQRKNGTGIYGMTLEERKKAGKRGGSTTKILGVGFFSLSSEEKTNAHRKSIESRGLVLWEELELQHLLELSEYKEYQKGMRFNTSKLADKLNKEFHEGKPVRNLNSVSLKLAAIRKIKGAK